VTVRFQKVFICGAKLPVRQCVRTWGQLENTDSASLSTLLSQNFGSKVEKFVFLKYVG
jgi:hypothetical protein